MSPFQTALLGAAVAPFRCRARRAAVAVLIALASTAQAPAAVPTTERRTVTGDQDASWSLLRRAPGSPRVLRGELAQPQRGRARRRRSLAYFAAIDEIHYTDEESPGRVEFLDKDGSPFTSAWKPNEALRAWGIDQTFRTVNAFRRSRLKGRHGRRARMALALTTGDNADNQQRNEMTAVRALLEGGRVETNSGREDAACAAPGEAARYTGVQDYGDYAPNAMFYSPDEPLGRFADWPRWPGLMDRAQQPFTARGLRVPSYLSLGNHDRLQQGNAWVNGGFQAVGTGCAKPFAPVSLNDLGDPLAAAGAVRTVPPDPERRSLSYPELRALFADGRQPDAHGFAYVDPQELRASNGAAAYYAFSPRPGLRLIAINTVSEGGTIGDSAEGNLDAPQFAWLERELAAADRRGQLVVVFGHHPIGSLRSVTPDEAAPPCTGAEPEPDPGCDLDPRDSRPVRGGAELQALLLAHPGVVAYVAGHTGAERLTPFARAGGGGFWQLESGSASDWPVGARLVELFDNRDGTLSLQTTLVNAAGPVAVPPAGSPAAGFTRRTLAAINRVLVFNDFQTDPGASFGAPPDRNAELLLPDPRQR